MATLLRIESSGVQGRRPARALARRVWIAPVATALLAVQFGCSQSGGGWFSRSPSGSAEEKLIDPGARSDIIRVSKFFSSDPWLCFNADGTNRVDGVKFSVYLESAGAAKGVFGTGPIIVTMYRLDRDRDGREVSTPVHEWTLSAEEAYPWRAKRETALGWGYGLRLPWDPNLAVAGRLVSFVVKYVREDGRVLQSSRQVARVPSTGAPFPTVAARTRAFTTFDSNRPPRGQTEKPPAGRSAIQGSTASPSPATEVSSAGASPGNNSRAYGAPTPGSPIAARPSELPGPSRAASPSATDWRLSYDPHVPMSEAPPADAPSTNGRPSAASRYTVTVTTEPPPPRRVPPTVQRR